MLNVIFKIWNGMLTPSYNIATSDNIVHLLNCILSMSIYQISSKIQRGAKKEGWPHAKIVS